MCGITGFIDFKKNYKQKQLEEIAEKMALEIKYRGPDDGGTWADQENGIALGHRRLSIQDLSPLGHQPMKSFSGRYYMVYNGEVYNAPAIRKELEDKNHTFKGGSDTEVMLASFEEWGIEKAVKKFIGMWAFALWDREKKELTLCRDRVGIKPLYWGFQKNILFFGSSLKSFRAHPEWNPDLDKDSLASYFRFSYVPAPHSIYNGIHKLKPGTLVTIKNTKAIAEKEYWSMQEVYSQGQSNPLQFSDTEAINQLETILKDAVKKRMLADVPLGAFLSGGYDSSLVVALMQSQSNQPIKTFSIGFEEADYNEAQHAKRVASHLKTDHHELYVRSKEAQEFIPSIFEYYDEPFADSSQIPTYLVSKLARQQVTVSLSGDGGDELFAGYNRYTLGMNTWNTLRKIPSFMQGPLSMTMESIPSKLWEVLAQLIPAEKRPNNISSKIKKLSEVLKFNSEIDFYKSLVSQWMHPDILVKGGKEKNLDIWNIENKGSDFISHMQLLDSLTYLPDDILTKVDRASMAVSLEARVPILDHRVIEYAWKLPLEMKIRHGKSKWILRELLHKYVPKSIMERPKMGFGVPIDTWLRTDLRDWAEDLLSEKSLKDTGVLNSAPIRERWMEHSQKNKNWHYSLWPVLMFISWSRYYKTKG
jgi:asparagine synthase (glutamine-hydrolysing)